MSCHHHVTIIYQITFSFHLTHWGQVTHICVWKLSSIVSDNGFSPGRRQAIIWTNAGILLIGHIGTNFNEILIEIHTFSFKKMHFKMSSGKWRTLSLGLNVLNDLHAQISMVTRVATGQLLIGLFREIKRNYIIQSYPYGIIHETREDYMYSGNNHGQKHAALWDTNDKTSWQSAMPNQDRNRKVWQDDSVWICKICTWFCCAWSYLGYNILVLKHAFNSKLVTVTNNGFITTKWWYSSQITEIHI